MLKQSVMVQHASMMHARSASAAQQVCLPPSQEVQCPAAGSQYLDLVMF